MVAKAKLVQCPACKGTKKLACPKCLGRSHAVKCRRCHGQGRGTLPGSATVYRCDAGCNANGDWAACRVCWNDGWVRGKECTNYKNWNPYAKHAPLREDCEKCHRAEYFSICTACNKEGNVVVTVN